MPRTNPPAPQNNGKSGKKAAPHTLVVEDDVVSCELLCHYLERMGIATVRASGSAEALALLKEHLSIRVLIVDLYLQDGHGIEVLRRAQGIRPGIFALVLSASDHIEDAVAAMKLGAADFMPKPFDPLTLLALITPALAKAQPAQALESPDPFVVQWKSQAMRACTEEAIEAARTESPVIILGHKNTGRGKLAQLVHSQSWNRRKDLVTVNCEVLKPADLETSLFGKEVSSAAGKLAGQAGWLEKQRGSNLYLANIDCIHPEIQFRLQQYLASPPAAAPDSEETPCRIISSAPADFEKTVLQGGFRYDLWYALSVYKVHSPRLAEIPEDIIRISEGLITKICLARKLPRPTLSRKAIEALIDHPWPGNLSELASVIEYAVTHTRDRIIGPSDLRIGEATRETESGAPNLMKIQLQGIGIRDVTKSAFFAALEACDGNRRRTATRLKVSLRTVYNMIARYGAPTKRQQKAKSKKAATKKTGSVKKRAASGKRSKAPAGTEDKTDTGSNSAA